MIQELKLKIKECIENYVSTTYGKEVTAVVEQPKNMEMGDIAVPVFVVMKTIGKPLPQVVTEIKELLLSSFSAIKEINPTGGFLNVRVEKEEMCSNILKEVVSNLNRVSGNTAPSFAKFELYSVFILPCFSVRSNIEENCMNWNNWVPK